jgi:hypothetical protein
MNYELAKELKDSKGQNNNRWKGNLASYQSKHQFLKRNYGNPLLCDFCGIQGYKENGGRWSIHFAKKLYKEYSHNREDYYGLCRVCHGKYDLNDKKIERFQKMGKLSKGIKSEKKSLIAKNRNRKYGRFI